MVSSVRYFLIRRLMLYRWQETEEGKGWGSNTRPIFEHSLAAEDLKPWPCLGQKNLKMHTLFRRTPSIILPWEKGQVTRRLVSRPFLANCCRANSSYSYCCCILGVLTILSSKSINQSRRQYPVCN